MIGKTAIPRDGTASRRASRHKPDRTKPHGLGRRTVPAVDRGSMTLFVAILAPAVLVFIGLIADGSIQLRAGREAMFIAGEAARAGAGHIDRAAAYGTPGRYTVDPQVAADQARRWLARNNHRGTVTITGDRTLHVTVETTRKTIFLGVIGHDTITTTGQASAELLPGVTEPVP